MNVFQGEIPVKDARLLPDPNAVEAENVRVDAGTLRGIGSPKLIRALQPTTRRIYRIPGADISDWASSTWMEFSDVNTDVVRSPIVNDAYDRYYWASPSTGPLWSPKQRIIDGLAPYKLGLPGPTTAPTLAGAGGSGTIVTRSYVVTFIDQYGHESQPSPPVEGATYTNATWNVNNIPQPVADPSRAPVTKIRIYRTTTATSGTTTFFKVGEVNVGVTTFADTTTDTVATGGGQIESIMWAPPPADLQGMIAMPNGILVGWVGNDLYFSENYRPHAWPAEYVLTTEYPIVGLGVFGNTCVVCTSGHPAAVTGVKASTMNFVTNTTAAPCLSRRSIVSTLNGVLYASEAGLILFSQSGPMDASSHLVDRDQWVDVYTPAQLRAIHYGNNYTAVRTSTGDDDGFYFNPVDQTGAGVVRLTDLGAAVDIDIDIWTGKPFLLANGNLYEWLAPNALPLEWRWRSKEMVLPKPLNLACYRVYFDDPLPGMVGPDEAPVTLKVWAWLVGENGETTRKLVYDHPVMQANQVYRLPSGFKSDIWQVELMGKTRVRALHMATNPRELVRV